MHGEIIGARGVGRALNLPVPAPAQAGGKILRVIQRPIEVAAAIRALQVNVVVRTHLAVRQVGREDMHAGARRDDEIVRGIVAGNRGGLVGRPLISAGAKYVVQAVVAAIAIDADAPRAFGHVQRIITVGAGVHISLIIGAVDGGIGAHADAHDVRAVGLYVAGDIIRREDGGDILKHGLPGGDAAVYRFL